MPIDVRPVRADELVGFIDAISTADGLVVILGNKGEACTLGVSLDGSSLTLIAILIGPHIGRA